jgi:hypothetical protein
MQQKRSMTWWEEFGVLTGAGGIVASILGAQLTYMYGTRQRLTDTGMLERATCSTQALIRSTHEDTQVLIWTTHENTQARIHTTHGGTYALIRRNHKDTHALIREMQAETRMVLENAWINGPMSASARPSRPCRHCGPDARDHVEGLGQ